MRLFRILLLAASLFAAGLAQAGEFTAKVLAVMDGDTLLVMRGGKPVKLRLAEVDAPEKAQPYGTASQESLAELVMGKQVRVESRAVDDYGRIVALVHLDGLNVNHEQVRRGMAWEYSRFHSNKALMALQREAQLARRGLWAGEDIVEPSQWRKQHGAARPQPGAVVSSAHPSDPACAGKRNCSQMVSCDEAKRYLERCGPRSLDGDRDGRPCEKLCGPDPQNMRR